MSDSIYGEYRQIISVGPNKPETIFKRCQHFQSHFQEMHCRHCCRSLYMEWTKKTAQPKKKKKNWCFGVSSNTSFAFFMSFGRHALVGSTSPSGRAHNGPVPMFFMQHKNSCPKKFSRASR